MTKAHQYILNEVKVIEKECLKKGISPIEWIERYAEGYHRKWGNDSMPRLVCLKRRRG